MQPIILITVFRRYFELLSSLDNIESLHGEFNKKPIIVVVWSSPEVKHLWFFQELLAQKRINHLVVRYQTPQDGIGRATTYPESLNLRLGLEFIDKEYQGWNYYVIGQAADIIVAPGTYGLINNKIQSVKAVLFHWHNGISHRCWHTNFFAVAHKDYWPPISSLDENNTLEVQWAMYLDGNNLSQFYKTHNSRELKFQHINVPQNQKIDEKLQDGVFTVNCTLSGYKSIWYYMKQFYKWFFKTRGSYGEYRC